ncbi:serine/threonine-protein kinase [Candidatus Uabimicrobium amorphum]|uniref:non-specific serine/threonine protein kinase n=1 Tax=Uabimicrobium amorphum TaxID=2596890 RepID=A0A5S9IST9_UABAM|nr:serine/threonine-protein kinase [Candidatus Uabimicrobium amorphum]BBM86005.1 protein kinase [Candidatus Uabimicrobium amorphum]
MAKKSDGQSVGKGKTTQAAKHHNRDHQPPQNQHLHDDLLGLKDFVTSSPPSIPGYRVTSICGKGGMGTVYKAWDEKLKRKVAIKVIPKATIHEESRQRFLRETQLTSQLVHPNIVRLYQTGETHDYIFFVMQYIEGSDLFSHVEENNLSSRRIAQIVIRILDALVYAHENNVVHRDLKPGNILVDKTGIPIVMDFGLAKTIGGDYSLTTTGQILGTPYYMSPEQIEFPKQINVSSDIFSLGVILYQLLTKELPFDGAREIQVFHSIMNDDPTPLRKINTRIAQKLELICLKAMRKSPQKRYTAKKMRDDLQAFCDGKHISVSRLQFVLGRKIIFCAFMLLVAVMAAIFFVFSTSPQKNTLNIDQLSYESLPLSQKINYIDNLISYGAYEEAGQYLNDILKKTVSNNAKQNLLQKMVIILVKMKKYDSALTEFAKLSKNKTDELLLAISRAYLAQQDLSQAQRYINQVTSKTPEYLAIRGQLAFRNSEYLKAITFFQKLRDKFPRSSQVVNAQFFYAKSLFILDSKKHFKTIISLLKPLEKRFSQTVLIYEYLGRTYLQNAHTSQNLSKAQHYFEKSLRLSPYNSDYFVYLARTQIKLKQLDSAFKNITTALEKQADNENALKAMLQLTLQDATRVPDSFNFMKFYVDKGFDLQIRSPSLFDKEMANIRDTYATAYNEWRFYTGQKPQINLHTYFAVLANPDAAQEIYQASLLGLRNARYQENWEQTFDTFLQTVSPKPRRRLLQIKKLIVRQKKREYNQALNHVMARFFLQSNAKTLRELREHIPQIQEILLDNKQDSFIRYLAADTLGKLHQFEQLEFYRIQQVGTVHDLSCIVLRNHKFFISEGTLLDIIATNDNNFVKCMAIYALYSNSSPGIQVKQQLRSLLGSNNLKIKLYAAASLWQEPEAIAILKETIANKKISQQKFAHYYLWKNISPSFLERNRTLFEKTAAKNDVFIQAILLHYLEKNNHDGLVPWTWKCFQRYSQTILVCKAFSIAVTKEPQAKMIFQFFTQQPLHPQQNKSSIVKVYMYMELLKSLTNHHVTYAAKNDLIAMARIRNLIRMVVATVPFITKEKNNYFKFMAYYLTAIFDCRALRNLPHESNNDIKAHIFYGLSLETIGQRIPPDIPKPLQKSVKAIWQSILRKHGYYDRKKVNGIIDLYTQSSHDHLRKNAYIAQVIFCYKQRQKLYENALASQNTFIRQATAKGFHSLLEIKVHNNIPLGKRGSRKSLEYHYWNHLEILRELMDTSQKHNNYIDFMDKAIELDPSRSEYYFERGYLFFLTNKKNRAIEDWRQAVKKSPENAVYRYFLAQSLFRNKDLTAAKKLLWDIKPQSEKTISKTAVLSFQLRQNKLAQKMLKQMRDSYQLSIEQSILLLRTYLRQNNKSYAKIYLQHLRRSYPNHNLLRDAHLNQYAEFRKTLGKEQR